MRVIENNDLEKFLEKKKIIDREKYIITEIILYIEEILDWKKYIFEKIRVKINWNIMLNLKSVQKLKD